MMSCMTDPIDLEYPFVGRWMVQNSPADRVPSHGTARFATSYAIDFVPVDEALRSARFGIASLLRPEPPENFAGFGRSVLAPVEGTVVAVHDSEPDHPAYRGLPSLGYALLQRKRIEAGWQALAGNHIMIDSGTAVVALCHLQRGSMQVQCGARVRAGDPVGRCGNSGNSTEPHLHLQAFDSIDVERASAVSIRFGDGLPSNGALVHVSG